MAAPENNTVRTIRIDRMAFPSLFRPRRGAIAPRFDGMRSNARAQFLAAPEVRCDSGFRRTGSADETRNPAVDWQDRQFRPLARSPDRAEPDRVLERPPATLPYRDDEASCRAPRSAPSRRCAQHTLRQRGR